jgi:hypothetical protein
MLTFGSAPFNDTTFQGDQVRGFGFLHPVCAALTRESTATREASHRRRRRGSSTACCGPR